MRKKSVPKRFTGMGIVQVRGSSKKNPRRAGKVAWGWKSNEFVISKGGKCTATQYFLKSEKGCCRPMDLNDDLDFGNAMLIDENHLDAFSGRLMRKMANLPETRNKDERFAMLKPLLAENGIQISRDKNDWMVARSTGAPAKPAAAAPVAQMPKRRGRPPKIKDAPAAAPAPAPKKPATKAKVKAKVQSRRQRLSAEILGLIGNVGNQASGAAETNIREGLKSGKYKAGDVFKVRVNVSVETLSFKHSIEVDKK